VKHCKREFIIQIFRLLKMKNKMEVCDTLKRQSIEK
jgi:hypothetical protein